MEAILSAWALLATFTAASPDIATVAVGGEPVTPIRAYHWRLEFAPELPLATVGDAEAVSPPAASPGAGESSLIGSADLLQDAALMNPTFVEQMVAAGYPHSGCVGRHLDRQRGPWTISVPFAW